MDKLKGEKKMEVGVCSLKNVVMLAGATSMWRILLINYLTNRSDALWNIL